MILGMYCLPERDVYLDENASVTDLLLVIGELTAELEWWKRQCGIYRDRAGFDPSFADAQRAGTTPVQVRVPPRFKFWRGKQ